MKSTPQVKPIGPNVDEVSKKADLFYDYAVQIHKEMLDKYRRLEDKSMKFLTIISIVITVSIFIFNSYRKDIFSNYQYEFMVFVVYTEIIIFSLCLCCAWGHILASIATKQLKVLPSDRDSVLSFIMANDKAFHKIKIAIAKRILENTKLLHSFHEEKAKFATFAEDEIKYSGIMLVVVIITIIFFKLFT